MPTRDLAGVQRDREDLAVGHPSLDARRLLSG